MARDLVFNFLSGWTVKKLAVSLFGVHRSRNWRDESVCYVMLCYVWMNTVTFANPILVCFLAGAGWRA